MANIEIEVAGRRYPVACRDGEEAHIRSVAALVDRRARDAAAALGSLGESRQLLFAALLLADDLAGRDNQDEGDDGRLADAAEALAARVEAIAEMMEAGARAAKA